MVVEMTATAIRESPVGRVPPLTVGAYLLDWLSHVRGRVRRVTYEGYECLLRCHAIPALGAVEMGRLTPLRLQQLYGELLDGSGSRPALSGGSVLNLHLVLNQALGQAVRWQLIAVNPAAGVQPPRPKRSQRVVVDPDLAQRLLEESAGTVYELPCALALATGMRRGEVLALRWTDVSGDFTSLQVVRTLQPSQEGLVYEEPKTARSRRAVLLPDFVRPFLERQRDSQARRREMGVHWEEEGLVIDRGDGAALNPDTLSTGWARHLRTRGLPRVRYHDLRHAHATLLLLQGVHPKIVSERLGHASIGITLDTYSHVLPSLQSQAAAAFDSLFPRASGETTEA